MAFKLRSGNSTTFKNMGTSPFKDMKTGKYEHSFESPAKQRLKKRGEAQDEDKILDNRGNHVGNWVNGKKVMFNDKPVKDKTIKGGDTCAKCGALRQNHKSTTHAFTTSASDPDWEGGDTYDVKPAKKKKSPAKHPAHEDHHAKKEEYKEKFPEEYDKIMRLKKLHLKPDSSPAKQTDTTWADGSKKSKRQIAEQKMHPSEYWYKIDGKKATKAQYIKYKNVPGKMEGGGKQTNDPTVSLARQSADKRQKKQ